MEKKKEDLKAGYPEILSSLHPHSVQHSYHDTKETHEFMFVCLFFKFRVQFYLSVYRKVVLLLHLPSFK